MSIKHKFASGIPDGLDPALVKPSDWNNDHEVDFNGMAKAVSGVLAQAQPGVDYLEPDGSGSQLTNITAEQVGLGNVTNESKATMFSSPAFTGVPTVPTATVNTNTTQAASTEFVLSQAGAATPLAPAVTALVGTATKFAREDHKHPTNFTSTGTDIKMNGTQAVGTLTTFPRADHVHPIDTSRAPVASPTFTGTATAPSFASTVITGTAPMTVESTTMVTNLNANLLGGTALSGLSPVAGSSSITTLGTIATGTWNATTIAPGKGGTGVANGTSNTITFTGNYSLGLTLSAATSVTLPTTGTLSTLAGTETFTNKTLTSPRINEAVALTATATELNRLDGVTVTTADINSITSKVPRTSTTGSAQVPVGTQAQRDGSPAAGYLRFNSDVSKFEGHNGTTWTSVGGGATGGGSDAIFIENGQTVTASYTISTGKNAGTFGSVTIADGITVTIPDGSVWTIV